MDKEEPSLADKFVASTYKRYRMPGHVRRISDEVMLSYRVAMRNAHRFVLTDEFTEMATHMSMVRPEVIMARIQYATLPYDTTWIEFDLTTKMRVSNAAHGRAHDPDNYSTTGMLLQRIDDTSFICTCVDETADGDVIPHVTCYLLSSVPSEDLITGKKSRFGCEQLSAVVQREGEDAADKSWPLPEVMEERDIAAASLWGYSASASSYEPQQPLPGTAISTVMPPLLAKHGACGTSHYYKLMYDMLVAAGKLSLLSTLLMSEMREFTGTARWLVTVLAMLNEVPVSTEHVVPTGYQRAGLTGKTRKLDYHKVALVLPKTNPIKYLNRRLSHAEITRRRAHEVRAHWRTYLPEPHCGYEKHEWEYDHEHGYRLCGKCMAYGRLIHEHIRGDVKLGWVRKDYVIKAVTRSA